MLLDSMVIAKASSSFGNEYVSHVATVENAIVVGLTDGSVHALDFDLETAKALFKGDSQVTGLGVHDSNVVSVGNAKGQIAVIDLRTGKTQVRVDFKAPLACLAGRQNELAFGTELFQHDATVALYDLRTPGSPFRKYTDSHNDDVTDVRFHPTHKNMLLSGSTDGIINIFNTDIVDEDDAVYQTINHESSIHRTGILSENRVFALSHMETMSIYQVANPDENIEEPAPNNFGDLREKWQCQYVADYADGYFLVGTNAESKLKLVPFANEAAGTPINLEGAHGEEVVRGFSFHKNAVYTGGEDGLVKVWTLENPEKRRGPLPKTHLHKKPY